ncbi:YqjF family protein [Paenibacillus cremeus]|nr:DUF2071 domain-containing protein [Paenibacillus cremeus]
MLNEQRPWPVPKSPWIIKQIWHDLLFLHYPVAIEAIQPYIPKGLVLDTFEGKAWISIVPFWMSHIRLRWTPPMPVVSKALELNVRTYVLVGNKPGVYFFSLDIDGLLGVMVGRACFKLPYYYAKMKLDRIAHTVDYQSKRTKDGQQTFEGSYQAASEKFHAKQGSLDYWLVERYCLYSHLKGKNYICEIDHEPWNLQRVDYKVTNNTMLANYNIELPEPYAAHYCPKNEVHIWPLKRIR